MINPQADPQLVFTSPEGLAISRLFTHSDIDEGQTGTKRRLVERPRGQAYFHFSCHGSYDWNDPPSSGLDLADGRLTLADLQQGLVDLSSTRLVTLSACETGITNVLQGSADEYVGVPASFLLVGVPCVVSSLWTVPDLSTAMLMERFYQNHLESKMDFAAALHQAQRWVRTVSIGEVARYASSATVNLVVSITTDCTSRCATTNLLPSRIQHCAILPIRIIGRHSRSMDCQRHLFHEKGDAGIVSLPSFCLRARSPGRRSQAQNPFCPD